MAAITSSLMLTESYKASDLLKDSTLLAATRVLIIVQAAVAGLMVNFSFGVYCAHKSMKAYIDSKALPKVLYITVFALDLLDLVLEISIIVCASLLNKTYSDEQTQQLLDID